MPHNRPISPHLQIYKLPLTALLSISHRLTGVFLSLSLVGLAWGVWQIHLGEAAFQAMQHWLSTPLLHVISVGCLYAFMFHLCHGTRHLLWDVGYTLSREKLTLYAFVECVMSVMLTLFAAEALR